MVGKEITKDILDFLDLFPIPIGIYNTNYNLEFANKAAYKIYGEDKVNSMLSGKKCYKVLHGKDEPCSNCLISQIVNNGRLVEDKIYNYETDSPIKVDGHWYIGSLLFPVRYKGKPMFMQLAVIYKEKLNGDVKKYNAFDIDKVYNAIEKMRQAMEVRRNVVSQAV